MTTKRPTTPPAPTDSGWNALSRRQFMTLASSSVGAFTLVACGGGSNNAASGPAPAPGGSPPPTSGPSPAPLVPPPPPPPPPPAIAPGAVPAIRLSSGTTGTVPFCLGQAFRQGDVPTGKSINAAITEFQSVVKNRWPDGSVKFAILSGKASVTAGTPRSIALGVIDTPAAPTALSLADLKATGVNAAISYGAYGTVSWSGTDWDTPFQSWISGAQMSSWVYRKPIGSDAHLVAWLEVRCYSGGAVEVLPWIENGYLNVAAPGQRSGTATFTLGGSTRFSQSLTLLNHTRAVLASGTTLTHWLGSDPQVIGQHDVTYLMATRLVSNYRAVTSGSSTLFTRLTTSYTPLAQADYSPAMGSTGYHPSIGLLPEWDVAYLTTNADARARRAVIVNAYCAGRFGIHYRDATTNRALAFSSYPNLVMGDGSGITDIGSSSTSSYTPTATGTSPPQFKTSHHPSMGYMAYLLTGWRYFMEETQFLATANYLKQTDTVRQFSKGVLQTSTGTNQVRGASWATRTLAQAAAITPDDDALRTEFVSCVNENINWYHARYVAQANNPQGLVEPYDDYSSGANPLESATWQDDFFTSAYGLMRDIAPYSAGAVTTRIQQFTEWKYKAIVGRLGGNGAAEFSYRHAAQYTVYFAPSDSANYTNGTGPWYSSWGAIARAMGIAQDGTAGQTLVDGYYPDPTSYWGNLMPALAYAHDHGASGATDAWNRVAGAANFGDIVSGFNDDPVWSVKPRGA